MMALDLARNKLDRSPTAGSRFIAIRDAGWEYRLDPDLVLPTGWDDVERRANAIPPGHTYTLVNLSVGAKDAPSIAQSDFVQSTDASGWLGHGMMLIDAFALAARSAPTGWAKLSADVDRWAKLPVDWDGRGGEPPSEAVIEAGRAFLSRLEADGTIPIPVGYVAGDCEIGFRWKKPRCYASASFVDDGSILAYAHIDEKVAIRLDEFWSPDLNLDAFLAELRHFA